MKLLSTLMAFALVAAVFTGCTKEAAKTTSSHFLSATGSGGISYSATGSNVYCDGATGAKINIHGESSSGERFLVIVNPYSGATGTFAIGGDMMCQHTNSSGVTRVSASGSITLTATTPDIVGTFSFTATDGTTYTGSFNSPTPTP